MRALLSCLLPLLVAAVPASSALAQAYPNRPITLAVPFVTGSNVEIMIRAMSAEASKQLGQTVVVENRPGANLRLPILALKKSAADGYTLAIANEALLVSQPIMDPEFKQEVGKDYAPVSFLLSQPLVVAAHASVPFRDLKGLIAYAKANPGKLNMVGGPGSVTQTTAERISQQGNFKWTFIPYKDSQQAMPDLLQGRVDLTITGTIAKPGIDSGKLVGIATTGTARWSPFPELPTLQELGLNMNALTWYAVIAPAGTPADVVRRLNAAYNAAIASPTIAKRMSELGMSPGYAAPEQFESFIRSEVAAWSPIIKAAGITMQ